MVIHTRQVDDVLVVDISGRLDTESSESASDELASLLESGSNKMLLNLDELDFVSSAGLRVFLRASKRLQAANGALKICHANGSVHDVMEISGLARLIEIHENETAAISAF